MGGGNGVDPTFLEYATESLLGEGVNRVARIFVVVYSAALHLLVFYTLARHSHASVHHHMGAAEIQLLCARQVAPYILVVLERTNSLTFSAQHAGASCIGS